MIHVRQSYPVSCGAAAYSMIAGCSESAAIRKCKTTKKGTWTGDVKSALKKRKIPFLFLELNLDFSSILGHLRLLSFEYPLYLSCVFVYRTERGGIKKDYHAVAAKNGEIFDSAENFPIDFEAFTHKILSEGTREFIPVGNPTRL